jgi:hypothetical protein
MKKTFAAAILLCLGMLSSSCGEEELSEGPNISTVDMAPADKMESGLGIFTSYAHDLSGKAILLCGSDSKAIRLEDFNMLAGPDVYVFVSKSNNYSKANVIEIAKLTSGYLDSDINFEFNASSYTNEYKFVLVYCVQYNSLFGYAELR